MKNEVKLINQLRYDISTFSNTIDFARYLKTAPTTKAAIDCFGSEERLSSNRIDNDWENSKSWTRARDYQHAFDMFVNGWTQQTEKLTQRINSQKCDLQIEKQVRTIAAQAGFAPIVAAYLNNQPNAMRQQKMTPVKQRVVTINKNISYSKSVSSSEIFEQSVKALQIVQKIEAQGIRVNLNVFDCCKDTYNNIFVIKVGIKSANERLNVSKTTFPLVHPSMLRRLVFRYEETHPAISANYLTYRGYPIIDQRTIANAFNKGEYILPSFINRPIDTLNNLTDIQKL